jgi:hypothetical protein
MTCACLEPAPAREAGRRAARTLWRALPGWETKARSSVCSSASDSRMLSFSDSRRPARILSLSLVMSNAMAQPLWSRRRTGRSPRARTSSMRPRSIWLFDDSLRGCALQTRRQHHAAVPPPCGGRQNDLLGLGKFCRRHVRDPSGFAARAAATAAAPLRRRSPAGQDPREALPLDGSITAPFAAECQSFLRLFLMLFCVPRIRKCRPPQALCCS